ncbi:hypothetical protein VC83_01609 [Pseudogymnoascus destructans]|uniref:Uncharacterized protein n=1 Tax=Pseudogymnoascus destructans TaxID=655981 RepID=A0A177AKM4_9PEZI|nr:uncharacterized protein VC83_01609 [Pseudogymnoascus destructans]OAF61833.1 hypothetical protein VC83_01609 [Pseudogymnoascus destructans]
MLPNCGLQSLRGVRSFFAVSLGATSAVFSVLAYWLSELPPRYVGASSASTTPVSAGASTSPSSVSIGSCSSENTSELSGPSALLQVWTQGLAVITLCSMTAIICFVSAIFSMRLISPISTHRPTPIVHRDSHIHRHKPSPTMPIKSHYTRQLILHLLLYNHRPHRLLQPHHRLQDSSQRAPAFAVHLNNIGEQELRLLDSHYLAVRVSVVESAVFE